MPSAKNILLCGHACGPRRGSEPGLTWNWAWHLSAKHRVWVLTHPQYRSETEDYLQEHPNGNIKFIWVSLPKWLDPWNPLHGQKGISLHYVVWQHAALRAAKRVAAEVDFDICHYVSWATVNSAPLLWKLHIPFFWGPVGGGQTAPLAFRKFLGPAWRKEAIRNIRVNLRSAAPALHRAVRRSALVLAANRDTQTLLKAAGAERVRLFLDNGLPEDLLADHVTDKTPRSELRLHWSGRLELYKALPLTLQALAEATKPGDVKVHLEISGIGPEQGHCEALVKSLGISDRVVFLGQVPRAELFEKFRQADALICTSLRDTCPSVCIEAMGQGLPIIHIDHQGMRDFVPAEAGWKVPLTNPSETASQLALAIRQAASNSEDRRTRAQTALAYAKSQSWKLRAEYMDSLYEEYRNSLVAGI